MYERRFAKRTKIIKSRTPTTLVNGRGVVEKAFVKTRDYTFYDGCWCEREFDMRKAYFRLHKTLTSAKHLIARAKN